MARSKDSTSKRPLIRVCAYCDAIRSTWPDGTERWLQPQGRLWPETRVSHGICPKCLEEVVAELGAKLHRYGIGVDTQTDR